MSAMEATMSMMETMPEEAQLQIFEFARNIFTSIRPANPFTPVTKEDIIRDLAESSAEFDAGLGMNARDAIQAMRKQHGFV